jgi:hypothetical protein
LPPSLLSGGTQLLCRLVVILVGSKKGVYFISPGVVAINLLLFGALKFARELVYLCILIDVLAGLFGLILVAIGCLLRKCLLLPAARP